MTASKGKKARKLAIEELQPGEGMVELTESEAEAAVGGTMVSGFEVALGDGSVRFHNYKTAGTVTPETL
jgi:hypothetical protein